MSDLVECPMCGQVHRISEDQIDDNKIVGCNLYGSLMMCHGCACDPYDSEKCKAERKGETYKLMTAGEM